MPNPSGRMHGKIALVTGGASGLGKATAELFVAEGGRVMIADIDAARGEAAAASLGEAGGFVRLDVTDEAAWTAAYAAVKQRFGGVHVLVQSAGIAITAAVTETSLEDWRRVHAIDLDGVFLGCKHGVPAIAASVADPASGSATGAIVNISSIAGVIAGHNMAAYNSAKAGVRHLSKSVALHCARQGLPIRCNSVHPAFVDTPILDDVARNMDREQALGKLGRQVPMGRIGQPREVAYGILYLASDESSFTTGSELLIDGGIAAM
ncbi:MAG: SDR family oxidoreductase [Alphaproteobacteria bacterium]|nr:SDR family oxidoreductase [Alphaproteobacteria bacterium]MCB9930393.1 SDR family oxidoreductase [Alphaproteobacteria bacterium]